MQTAGSTAGRTTSRTVRLAKDLHPELIVIEDAYVGRGAHASLESAHAGGFIRGALWCAGVFYDSTLWRPKPSAWRKVMGFAQRPRKAAEEDARAFARGATKKALRGVHGGEQVFTHEAEAVAMAAAGWEHMLELRRPSAS